MGAIGGIVSGVTDLVGSIKDASAGKKAKKQEKKQKEQQQMMLMMQALQMAQTVSQAAKGKPPAGTTQMPGMAGIGR